MPIQCIKFSGIKEGSIVYDPFVGTGTTVVAANIMKMRAIGTDIDKEYIKFSKKRFAAESTSLQAELNLD